MSPVRHKLGMSAIKVCFRKRDSSGFRKLRAANKIRKKWDTRQMHLTQAYDYNTRKMKRKKDGLSFLPQGIYTDKMFECQ